LKTTTKINVFAMKKLLIIICVLSIVFPTSAQKRETTKNVNNFRYELECAGNASQGNYLVKVWSYSKKASVAAEQCKRNAVHGVIFKGFSGNQGCVSQRPMAGDPGVEFEFEEYFQEFFKEGGEYLKYVVLTAGTQEIVKIGKEYKVGVVVTVHKDALRKTLEKAGVIKGLSSGF
jgi:hypothetical protein